MRCLFSTVIDTVQAEAEHKLVSKTYLAQLLVGTQAAQNLTGVAGVVVLQRQQAAPAGHGTAPRFSRARLA
jgi:hypothetical protein